MDKKLRSILLSLGITPNLKGFEYICAMVKIIREEKEATKITYYYEVVGKKLGVKGIKGKSVERDIRTAISKVNFPAWVSMGGSGLKNSEFLYTLELLTREE